MNAVSVVIGSICILVIAYRLYGYFFTNKVLKINESKPTPAHELEDGKDYVPTNKWVTFGHHFAAIAAAGPLVGPILAAQFGYLPGLLWLLIGLVTYIIRGEECEIISLDSVEENQGIGTKLVQEVEKTSLEKGCKQVTLITTNDNLNALKFYQKRGYHLTKVYPNAVEIARKYKLEIPLIGNEGIPIRDEIELRKTLV